MREVPLLHCRIPDDDKSSVVYKINCGDCDASYVGETGRALKTRVLEHRRAMEKRDFSASALAQHAWEHNHHIDWTSTCVLGIESHYRSSMSRNLRSCNAMIELCLCIRHSTYIFKVLKFIYILHRMKHNT